MTASRQNEPRTELMTGLAAAVTAFVIWGLITIYWHALNQVPLFEVVAHRTIWACLFAGLWLTWRGELDDAWTALGDPAKRRYLALSSILLMLNWTVFILAISWNQVLQASLGYFINPLMSVAIGTFLLNERLNRAQTIAVALASFAVLIQAVLMGTIPWLALIMAASFAIYGLLRKQAPVRSGTGIFVESVLLVPLAFAVLIVGGLMRWQWFGAPSAPHAFSQLLSDPFHALLLIGSGPATAVPLILFGVAAQRLRLTTLGLLQYIAPSLQFLLAIFLFAEPLEPLRMFTFALIWFALAIITVDALRRS
jgi:chloramphenicol-sensitive protein RarD